MYGLVFDERDALDLARSKETLDAAAALIARMPSRKFLIAAHDFRSGDAQENLRRSEARAAAVGNALAARGVDTARIEAGATGSTRGEAQIDSEVQRMLWTRVDLQLLP
jgi:outer membrane protein OmpA-like peptidoglycan-associated protein